MSRRYSTNGEEKSDKNPELTTKVRLKQVYGYVMTLVNMNNEIDK